MPSDPNLLIGSPAQTPTALVKEFFILGLTNDGKPFRPGDWSERLCGVMACFQPENSGRNNQRLRYSPYVRPIVLNGVKSVVVNEVIRQVEPMAYDFLVSFVRDNDLQFVDACLLPLPEEKK